MANIKISAAAQDNFNKIKIGDRVLSRGEYQKFLRELKIVMDDFSSSLNQVLDDFLASIEEDKADDYHHLKEKYSNLFKEEGKFIEVKFNDFLKFWIDYNINYHNLNHLNYDNDKYKLVVNDFVLYLRYEYQIVYKRKTNQEALKIVWKEFDERRNSPPAAKSLDKRAVEEKKVIRKGIKSTTKDRYDNMLYRICDLVENKWMKESDRTVEKLEKIYKKAKGEYAKSNGTDPSYLNSMLKNTDGFEYIKIKLMKLYRENK
jgi:hypothetical protein